MDRSRGDSGRSSGKGWKFSKYIVWNSQGANEKIELKLGEKLKRIYNDYNRPCEICKTLPIEWYAEQYYQGPVKCM